MAIFEKEKNIISKYFTIDYLNSDECQNSVNIDVNWDYIYSIPEFGALKTLHQSPKWHSESEYVSGHVENVVECCRKYINENIMYMSNENATVLLLSALFHDIGKATTTFFKEKDGLWHHYNHEIESEKITRRILWDLGYRLREKVCALVRWHMEPLKVMRSNNIIGKIIELQKNVEDLNLLYLLKKFDIEGSVASNPELTEYDEDILVEFLMMYHSLGDRRLKDTFRVKHVVDSILNAKKKSVEVELYMGLPGAGKNTAIEKSMADGKDRAVISRDDIRVELGYCGADEKYIGTTEEENKVTAIFNERLKDAAELGKVIVINNMNNRRKYRDEYKRILKDYNVIWNYIYVEASEISKNIERRKNQIPEHVMIRLTEVFDFPTIDEYNKMDVIYT